MDNGASSYRRYLAGDDNGLAEIIRAYRDGLVFYLNGFVNDIHSAEDIAQDVFVKIAVKKPVFKERSSFKTWLYAIGRNEAYKQIRRRKLSYVPLETLPETAPAPESTESDYFNTESALTVHRCLGRLKSEYHQALWLYYFEGLSAAEIAVIMHKSVHNVETLLYRARRAAKCELETEGLNNENT